MNDLAVNQSATRPSTLAEAKVALQHDPGAGLGTGSFYWAMLQGLPDRVSDYALLAAFEQWLPVPIDEVEARFLRLADGTVLACGIEHPQLKDMAGDGARDDGSSSIRPSCTPEFVKKLVPDIDIAGLIEFRSGAYLPPRTRRRRLAIDVSVLLLLLTACGLLACGLLIRANSSERERQLALQATHALVVGALGPAQGAAADLDPVQRLEASLRLQRQARLVTELSPGDAAPSYEALLTAWPPDLRAQTNRVLVESNSIRLEALLESAEDAERLVKAVTGAMTHWRVGSRNLRRAREGFQLALVLIPSGLEEQPR